MPIDFYAVCHTHGLRGPGVWRCIDPNGLRWFLTEHASCDVRVHDENDATFDWPTTQGTEGTEK